GARPSDQFVDYIASPKPNGYRAIHTAVQYAGTGQHGCKPLTAAVPVEVRILTPAMHRLNEEGIIAALYRRANQYEDDPVIQKTCWWNRKDQAALREKLAANDIGTRSESDPLYVFTP